MRDRIDAGWRKEAGKEEEGCRKGETRKGGMLDRRDSGKEGWRKWWMLERKEAGKEGFMKGGCQEMRHLWHEGSRKGGILEFFTLDSGYHSQRKFMIYQFEYFLLYSKTADVNNTKLFPLRTFSKDYIWELLKKFFFWSDLRQFWMF